MSKNPITSSTKLVLLISPPMSTAVLWLSISLLCCRTSSSGEPAGDMVAVELLEESLDVGVLDSSCAVDDVDESGFGLRVVPAREFLWVGAGWLWSAVYVTMNMVGSDRFLSTCFLAKHAFELLHL
ncbi:hypothetical protein QQ045_029198 [Rhodiola kirilowii]